MTFPDHLLLKKSEEAAPDGHKLFTKSNSKMEKKYTITLRLSYDQFAWLGALCRRSKHTQNAVIRSLIENGTVRERITKEHIHIIRQLIGESTNLNQLAKQANTYGFFAVAKRCEKMAQRINQLIKQLKDDR